MQEKARPTHDSHELLCKWHGKLDCTWHAANDIIGSDRCDKVRAIPPPPNTSSWSDWSHRGSTGLLVALLDGAVRPEHRRRCAAGRHAFAGSLQRQKRAME